MSTPERDPLKPPDVIIVNKEVAARGQLHTAIAIWFEYGDPVSIHTLAAAARGILEGLVGGKHKLTHMRKWLKSFPDRVQKIVRDPQNYFKHSWTDTKAEKAAKPYQPLIGDLIIAARARVAASEVWKSSEAGTGSGERFAASVG